MPRVTVFMPIYNAGKYVSQAIASVLDQTFRDFDLVVLDDGSTDDSYAKALTSIGRDARCRLITRQNLGVALTRNEGLTLATGEFIFCMDADDVSMPSRLEQQVSFLDAHPSCVAVGTRMLICDPELMPIIEMIDAIDHETIDAFHMRGDIALCNGSIGMRREAIAQVGGYRKSFDHAEDFDLFLRLAEVGRLANLPSVLYKYRQHVESVGHARRDLQIASTRRAIVDACLRRGLECSDEAGLAPSYSSAAEIHRKWAWLALQGGNAVTARKHARIAVRLEPWRLDNLTLLACAVRGH